MRKPPLAPFGDRLRIDSMPGRQRVQARLTMLYRSTHCLCRTGASMQELSHNSSLCSWLYITPAHRGTKDLGSARHRRHHRPAQLAGYVYGHDPTGQARGATAWAALWFLAGRTRRALYRDWKSRREAGGAVGTSGVCQLCLAQDANVGSRSRSTVV